jgi:sn-glycerol 3-phosphate transport system ATP-binding protein
LGDQPVIVRTDDSTLHPAPGDVLKVRPQSGKVHWFDAGTGKRIA